VPPHKENRGGYFMGKLKIRKVLMAKEVTAEETIIFSLIRKCKIRENICLID
jgi:hypothetical protein